ncbi:nucleotide-binding alpha-beta plait domain-containing protein [Tanacetum coccineum]
MIMNLRLSGNDQDIHSINELQEEGGINDKKEQMGYEMNAPGKSVDSFEEGEIIGESDDGCVKDCMEKNLDDDVEKDIEDYVANGSSISVLHLRPPRTKEDDVAKISTSIFVSNFPEVFSAKDLFHACKQYGHVVDSFIPSKRSKDGKRFGFVRFINVFSVERLELRCSAQCLTEDEDFVKRLRSTLNQQYEFGVT